MLQRSFSSKPLMLGIAGLLLGLAGGLAFFFGLSLPQRCERFAGRPDRLERGFSRA